MRDNKSELRREARKIVNAAVELLARDLKKFSRKFAPIAFREETGMVRTIPGGSYLITDETAHINYATGSAYSADVLTPGHHWKFQNMRWGYGELTLTVTAERHAELTLTMGEDQLRLLSKSKAYPADRVGWQHMIADLRAGRTTLSGD